MSSLSLSDWLIFRENLPHQKLPFSKRNWGGGMHSICSYQGKLKPSLAYHLVEIFSKPGDVVVDPFSGAGTIPFEACRNGRIGVGIDISPLGYVLTRAKTGLHNPVVVRRIIEDIEKFLRSGEVTSAEIESARDVSFNSSVTDYFHEDTLREVLLARRYFLQNWAESDEWAFVFSCCLHLLHGNRPYALSRNSHPITPFSPTGPFEYRELIPRLQQKVERALHEFPEKFVNGKALMADCANPWMLGTLADAVITSPPFFDSTRFYMTNWMRYWFSGWERASFKEVDDFFETRQRKDIAVYGKFFSEGYAAMRPGGYMVLHLGFSKKCDMARELLKFSEPFFSHVDTFYEGVPKWESHGVKDKGTVSDHSYLILQRK